MEQIAFDPTDPKAALLQLPHASAVFALYGAEPKDEPYIGRTPNLRARLERLLQPSPKHPRRLQLAGRVRRIEYRLTGSDFESLLLQFKLIEKIYGPKSLEQDAPRRASLHPLSSAPTPTRASPSPTAPASAKPIGLTDLSPPAPPPSGSPKKPSSSSSCAAAPSSSSPIPAFPAASTPK